MVVLAVVADADDKDFRFLEEESSVAAENVKSGDDEVEVEQNEAAEDMDSTSEYSGDIK